MPAWDYKLIKQRVVDVGNPRKNSMPLDPEVNWRESAWKDVVDKAEAAESPKGHFTTPQRMLTEMGNSGWELVGITPPLSMPAAGDGPAFSWDTVFAYVFKGPSAADH